MNSRLSWYSYLALSCLVVSRSCPGKLDRLPQCLQAPQRNRPQKACVAVCGRRSFFPAKGIVRQSRARDETSAPGLLIPGTPCESNNFLSRTDEAVARQQLASRTVSVCFQSKTQEPTDHKRISAMLISLKENFDSI